MLRKQVYDVMPFVHLLCVIPDSCVIDLTKIDDIMYADCHYGNWRRSQLPCKPVCCFRRGHNRLLQDRVWCNFVRAIYKLNACLDRSQWSNLLLCV